MTNQEALKQIFECASAYEINLADKNIMFLFQDNPQQIQALETTFSRNNFLHLTGVKSPNGGKLNANEFYSACIGRRLKSSDFILAPDGTTQLKLMVLPYLVKANLSANMISVFNQRTISLFTDKVVGSQSKGCMGFIAAETAPYYIPNTVLKEDIRNITEHPQRRILATLSKRINEEKYSVVAYKAKGIGELRSKLPAHIKDKISCEI